jgi:multidrug transporter EmrE-like cation transporter
MAERPKPLVQISWRIHPLALGSVATNSAGNVLLARAMKEMRESLGADLSEGHFVAALVTVLSNPTFLVGVALLITFFLLFLTMLSKMDLSYVLPVTSFGYVITALLAAAFLGETVSATRWMGIFMISFGVLLVAQGKSVTDASSATANDAEPSA